MLVTERELVIIAEEEEFPAEFHPKAPSAEESREFVGIFTFIPRVRLKEFHVSRKDNCGVLALQARAEHGGEKLEIMFPPDQEKAVSKAMEHMLQRQTP